MKAAKLISLSGMICLSLNLWITGSIYAQTVNSNTGGVSIVEGTTPPDPSAVLDVISVTKGLLIPRVSKSALTSTGIGNLIPAADGLTVFVTAPSTERGYWFYDKPAGSWVKLGGGGSGDGLWTLHTNGTDIYRLNGNVGIGTDNPTDKLTVHGFANLVDGGSNMDLRLKLNGKSALTYFNTRNGGNNNSLYINRNWSSASSYYSDFSNLNLFGNVGIETDNPTNMLHLKSNATKQAIIRLQDDFIESGTTDKNDFLISSANGSGRLIDDQSVSVFIDSDNNSDNQAFSIFKNSDYVGGNVSQIFRVNENGSTEISTKGELRYKFSNIDRNGHDFSPLLTFYRTGANPRVMDIANDGNELNCNVGINIQWSDPGPMVTIGLPWSTDPNTNNTPFVVGGDLFYTGNFGVFSDSTLKINISNITNSVEKLKKIRPVSYNLKYDKNKRRKYGVIAQEIETVFPELVTNLEPMKEKAPNAPTLKTVDYIGFIPHLIEAIKEQQVIIERMQQEINDLKSKVK